MLGTNRPSYILMRLGTVEVEVEEDGPRHK